MPVHVCFTEQNNESRFDEIGQLFGVKPIGSVGRINREVRNFEAAGRERQTSSGRSGPRPSKLISRRTSCFVYPQAIRPRWKLSVTRISVSCVSAREQSRVKRASSLIILNRSRVNTFAELDPGGLSGKLQVTRGETNRGDPTDTPEETTTASKSIG